MNAYEGKAGMVYLQVNLCDQCLSALRYTYCIKGAFRPIPNRVVFFSGPSLAVTAGSRAAVLLRDTHPLVGSARPWSVGRPDRLVYVPSDSHAGCRLPSWPPAAGTAWHINIDSLHPVGSVQ